MLCFRRRRTGSKDSTEQDVQQTDEVTSDHDTHDNVYQNVTNTHNVTRTDSLGQPEKTGNISRSSLQLKVT